MRRLEQYRWLESEKTVLNVIAWKDLAAFAAGV